MVSTYAVWYGSTRGKHRLRLQVLSRRHARVSVRGVWSVATQRYINNLNSMTHAGSGQAPKVGMCPYMLDSMAIELHSGGSVPVRLFERRLLQVECKRSVNTRLVE
jgi:hypothetical protein